MPQFSLDEAQSLLRNAPATYAALLARLPPRLLEANEGPGTWSPIDVLRHVVWCEEGDWMERVRIIREHGPGRTFEPLDREGGFVRYAGWPVERLLQEFATLRARSLEEVEGLSLRSDDLAAEGSHPRFGRVTLEELLATWVTHDLAHLNQISRVLTREVGQHVGPWREFFSLLRERDG